MPDLTPQQISLLERIRASGFEIVAFPLYANCVGVKKGNCAALLAPVLPSQFRLVGAPSYLLVGNLSVRVRREGKEWFVWKERQLEVTQERQNEIAQFSRGLADLLLPSV
jgi:hypothetical protein